MPRAVRPIHQDSSAPPPRPAVSGTRGWWGLGVCLALTWLGCGPRGSQVQEAEAVRLLQINRAQAALDLLKAHDTAAAHYLKSVALFRLKLYDTAQAEVRQALDRAPDEPKYQAFDHVLDLPHGHPLAADKIIALYERQRTSGALALFATSAYMQKGDVSKSLAAFDACLHLVANAPEFHYEILKHAVSTDRRKEAAALIQSLIPAAPQDLEFLRELLAQALRGKLAASAEDLVGRIEALSVPDFSFKQAKAQVWLMLGRGDAAVALARETFVAESRSEAAGLWFAQVLAQVPARPEYQQDFRDLRTRFPKNLEILAQFCISLTREGALSEALDLINAALRTAPPGVQRDHLRDLALGLPLEAGQAQFAAQQLQLHRPEIDDPLLLKYFEARLLYLRQDLPAALARFREILAASSQAQGTTRELATDSLLWIERILADQMAAEKLQQLAREVPIPAPPVTSPPPPP